MVLKPDGRRATIGLDFDGTIAHHAPCPPVANPNGPVLGALDFVNWLVMRGYEIVVVSTRARTPEGMNGIVTWLKRHGFPSLAVSGEKVPFDLLIDDRALRFEGDFVRARMFLNNTPIPPRWENP